MSSTWNRSWVPTVLSIARAAASRDSPEDEPYKEQYAARDMLVRRREVGPVAPLSFHFRSRPSRSFCRGPRSAYVVEAGRIFRSP